MKADFDIGNLFYVILTIIFLIIGAVNKKKKPVVRKTGDVEFEPINDDSIKTQFQDIFKEFNPVPVEETRNEQYDFSGSDSIEETPSLDVIPDEYESPESTSIEGFSEKEYQQAVSSLDTPESDEGKPVFEYNAEEINNEAEHDYSRIPSEEDEYLVNLTENFDPKTAFVYTEIFNRKEF